MKKTLALLLALGGAFSLQTAIAADGAALFKSKPCAACHSIDAKLLGPAFKEVAAKYAGEADNKALLVKSITQGSSGKWGPIPMPPNAVTAEEADALAEWILTLK